MDSSVDHSVYSALNLGCFLRDIAVHRNRDAVEVVESISQDFPLRS